MNMSSERFEDLEDEVVGLLRYPSTLSQQEVANVTRLLGEMEHELQMAPAEYRQRMSSRLDSYRSQLGRAGKQSATAAAAMEASNAARQTVQQGLQVLQNTSDSITRSQQLSADTDRIGGEVVTDLGSQRESLQRTRERLAETDADLSQSQRLIRILRTRVIVNKFFLIAIIVLEVIILLAAIYIKFLS